MPLSERVRLNLRLADLYVRKPNQTSEIHASMQWMLALAELQLEIAHYTLKAGNGSQV